MATLIDLMRHGEPVGGSMYRGQLDHPLSETGWQQMRHATRKSCSWDHIVTSTLSRCAAFANELSIETGIGLSADRRLQEIGFGVWEGKTAAELEATSKAEFYAFYDDPIKNTPPQAEALTVFYQRILSAWQDLLQQYNGKHVLVVAHAGTIRVILSHCLMMPVDAMYRIHVPHAGISRLSVSGEGTRAYPQLIFHAGVL